MAPVYYDFSAPSPDAVSKAISDGTSAPLSRRARQHLIRVYTTLAVGGLIAALGVYVFSRSQIATFLPMIGSVLCVVAMPQFEDEVARLGIFGLLAFLQGLTIGGLVEFALDVDPVLPLVALFLTAIVFGAFSVAALYSEKRDMLYLGGTLYSLLGMLTIVGFLNIFLRSPLLSMFRLYGGFMVFCGYVCFDTQLILIKYDLGDRDYIYHAMALFVDMVGLFVRLVTILLRNHEDNVRRRSRSRSRY